MIIIGYIGVIIRSGSLTVGLAVCRSVWQSVGRSGSLSVGLAVGRMVWQSVGLAVSLSVGLAVCLSVGQLVGETHPRGSIVIPLFQIIHLSLQRKFVSQTPPTVFQLDADVHGIVL